MNIPQIQLHQQYAKLGMESERATITIRQPRAIVKQETIPAQLDIRNRRGTLEIDQEAAWAAYALDSPLRLNDRVYGQMRQVFLEGLARIVEKGNRMAAIHLGGNAIADIARDQAFDHPKVAVAGPASTLHVKLRYQANKPDVTYIPGKVRYDVRTFQPEFGYIPGKLDIYVRQRNVLEIIPPRIDFTL